MIAIIDCGVNNLRSVQKAFEAVGCRADVTADPDAVRRASKVVLPGVGAFGDGMEALRSAGVDQAFRDAVAAGKPCLGICLGMQLLFDHGEEGGHHQGLGLLPGEIRRFPAHPGLKVPHMGWNTLRHCLPHPLLEGLPDGSYVYFVHSYRACPADPAIVVSESDYPDPFPAIVARDNVMGCQFHPEKSQRVGLRIYANFAAL